MTPAKADTKPAEKSSKNTNGVIFRNTTEDHEGEGYQIIGVSVPKKKV